jgi:alkylated DNA repair dioxygenase AlkB
MLLKRCKISSLRPKKITQAVFSYADNFITPEEELLLIAEIEKIQLHTFNFHGYEAKRKVQSFGYDYSFEKKSLAQGLPIPAGFDWLVKRVADYISTDPQTLAELLVTEYPVDAVINWHRDAPPFDVIVGISLLSDCVFKLKPHDKEKQTRKSIISIPVKRRSVYVIRDEARSEWQHSIAPVQTVRYSITLRTLRNKKG